MKKLILNNAFLPLIILVLGTSVHARFEINASMPVVLQKQDNAPNELDSDTVYHVLAAEIAGRRNQVNAAIHHYLEVAKFSKNPELAKRATKVALYANDIDAAKTAIDFWLTHKPHDHEAYTILATINLHEQNANALKKTINQFFSTSLATKTDEKFYQIIPQIITNKSEIDMMSKALMPLIKKHPDNSKLKMTNAQLSLIDGEYQEAQKQIEPVLLTQPNSEEATLIKAKTLFAQDEIQAAINVLNSALNKTPHAVALKNLLAKIFLATKNFKNAEVIYQEILQHETDNTEALIALGMIHLEQKNTDKARDYLMHYQKLMPDDPNKHFYLGYLAEKEQDYTQAMQHYAKVISGSKKLSAQLQIAMLLAKSDRLLEARQHLLFLRPQNAYEHIQIILTEANILGTAELHQDAHEILSSAIDKYGYQVDLTYARGIINEKLKRFVEMEEDLKRILSKRPLDPDVLNALGFSLINNASTDRHHEGLSYITRALRIAPNDPAIVDSMGWAHYKLGQKDEALKYLKRAYKISNDGEIAAHLGEVMWMTGEKRGAINVWKSALKYNPHHEFLIQTIKRFSKETLDNI